MADKDAATTDKGTTGVQESASAKAAARQADDPNLAVARQTPAGVQALPAELDPDQQTPDHRQSLQEPIGAAVGQEGDAAGQVAGTTMERIPQEDLTPRAGPHWEQRVPLVPGGEAY